MADSLFDKTDDNQFDENKDYFAELTGPGGKFDRSKYTSDEDMYKAIAKGKVFADRTLDHKNKEFDELREDFLKVRAENIAKDKWEEMLAKRQQNPDNEPAPQPNAGNVEPSLKTEDIDTAVERKLREIETQRQEKSNTDKFESRWRERFGSNAKNILDEKMNTLGMSHEDLKYLVKRSPEAALNALGANQQQATYEAPPRSSLRSDNFSPQADIRDAVYYEKLRTTSPKVYFSEKTSTQRLKDMDSPDFMTRYNQRH